MSRQAKHSRQSATPHPPRRVVHPFMPAVHAADTQRTPAPARPAASVRPGADADAVEAEPAPVEREPGEFDRLVAFSDGVFAIAITLLVLSLQVPADLDPAELDDYLFDAWGQVFAYFLSFAVIGRFWISHHDMFSLLHGFDRRLIVLNLIYLSLIVLIPFPTELLGDFGDRTDAVVVYAFVVGTAALLTSRIVGDALRRGLVLPEARERAAAMASGILTPALVFYASIPVALLTPLAGQLVWLLLLLQWLPDRLRRRR